MRTGLSFGSGAGNYRSRAPGGPACALLAMAPGGSADVSARLREILARPSQVSPLMRLTADAISARAALVRLRRALGPSFSWE